MRILKRPACFGLSPLLRGLETMATRYGTGYFTSYSAALRYYGNPETVHAKAAAGEIHTGARPPLKPGDRLLVDPSEGRYVIEEGAK